MRGREGQVDEQPDQLLDIKDINGTEPVDAELQKYFKFFQHFA